MTLVAVLAACGGDDDVGQADPVDASPVESLDETWQEAPADTPRPPFIEGMDPAPTPYLLDYGEVLWVDADGVGRLIGDDWQDCGGLMGGLSDDEWHDRYSDVPGFAGLVCNPPEV